ncbi:adenylate cyclase [Rhizobiales bacterium GAS113]|nr:adenylate cyclase [Rhizobiales bacterium GAS113]
MAIEGTVERRLAAILAADIVGYSRLMGVDEVGTLRALQAIRRELADPAIAAHHGRVVKTTGDGILIEFSSMVDAVTCAVSIQRGMVTRNTDIPEDRRIVFRIGINLGDIIIDDADIHGDGVNIAARLEALADPGGIFLSGGAYEQVRDKVSFAFEDMGVQALKNIARPVQVHRVSLGKHALALPELALPDKPSLAVLPFQNMSGDSEQQYFADGMVDDIITALSRVPSLFVIARNSTFTYKGRAVDVRQVGRELGVRYVLEGAVRRSGDRLRITGQLIEAESGRHVWADKFDGTLADVFELQDSVTTHVVSAVEPNLRAAELNRTRGKPPTSLTAYDFYLQASYELSISERVNFDRAEALIRKAIELDPNYADAFALLAHTLGAAGAIGWRAQIDARTEALAAARTAVRLDGNNPVVLATNAYAEALCLGSFERSDDCAARALHLAPSSAHVRTECGIAFAHGGNFDAAISNLEVALRLNPLDPMAYRMYHGLAVAHVFARRLEEAEHWARRVLVDRPNQVTIRRYLSVALAHCGRIEEAHDVVEELLRLAPDSSLSRSRTAHFRHPWQLEMYIDGLRLAGLPD